MRAIESARGAGVEAEIVVVDDASSDETAKVCEALKGIRYVRVERNQRVAGARNLGILASSGEYITFLDDDDVRLPCSLSLQLKALEADPDAGMIYAQALIGDQDGLPVGRLYPLRCPQGDIFRDLLSRNFVPCGSAVFRRSCLYRVGLLDTAVPGLDDWDLWIRIAELYPVIALDQPVIIWRQSAPGSDQGSSTAVELVRLSASQFHERWMSLARAVDASPNVRRAAWNRFSTNMARHLVWEALRALSRARLRQSAHNLLMALRLFPLQVVREIFNGTNIRALLVKFKNRPVGTGTPAYFLERRSGRSK